MARHHLTLLLRTGHRPSGLLEGERAVTGSRVLGVGHTKRAKVSSSLWGTKHLVFLFHSPFTTHLRGATRIFDSGRFHSPELIVHSQLSTSHTNVENSHWCLELLFGEEICTLGTRAKMTRKLVYYGALMAFLAGKILGAILNSNLL